jgi:hypothetical protein
LIYQVSSSPYDIHVSSSSYDMHLPGIIEGAADGKGRGRQVCYMTYMYPPPHMTYDIYVPSSSYDIHMRRAEVGRCVACILLLISHMTYMYPPPHMTYMYPPPHLPRSAAVLDVRARATSSSLCSTPKTKLNLNLNPT